MIFFKNDGARYLVCFSRYFLSIKTTALRAIMHIFRGPMSVEAWQEISEFPKYEVSNYGNVRNKKNNHVLKRSINSQGNSTVLLFQGNLQKRKMVSHLVANTFMRNTKEHPFSTPTHLDGDKTNNHLTNLVWRPRWFAVQYHQQFYLKNPAHISRSIRTVQTGIVFENSFEAARYYCLLEYEIIKDAYTNGKGVFPYWYNFVIA